MVVICKYSFAEQGQVAGGLLYDAILYADTSKNMFAVNVLRTWDQCCTTFWMHVRRTYITLE